MSTLPFGIASCFLSNNHHTHQAWHYCQKGFYIYNTISLFFCTPSIFSTKKLFSYKKVTIFATASCLTVHIENIWRGEGMKCHTKRKCLLNALFLVLLNLRNSIPQIRNNAEVDTTGRYHVLPLVCRGLCSLMHT